MVCANRDGGNWGYGCLSRTRTALLLRALLLGCALVAGAALAEAQSQDLKLPAPIRELVWVQPFTLAKAFRYTWSKETPLVRDGLLIVLRADPALLTPSNGPEPVLYAGRYPIQRLNQGSSSGVVIGIVPEAIDLAQTPIWFGTPGLPERATLDSVKTERDRAAAAGIRPITPQRVKAATRAQLQAADLSSLLREHAAELVLKYAPAEKDLAATWRLPVARAPSGR